MIKALTGVFVLGIVVAVIGVIDWAVTREAFPAFWIVFGGLMAAIAIGYAAMIDPEAVYQHYFHLKGKKLTAIEEADLTDYD